jgi:hypothetical protein
MLCTGTKKELETTKTNLASTRTELNSVTKSAVADLVTKLNGKNIFNEVFYETRLKELNFIFNSPNE